MSLGLNLAALALLGAVLASGTEPGGLGARWTAWGLPGAAGLLVGLPVFRFPRSVGLPVLVLAAAGAWAVTDALKDFAPLGPGWAAPSAQPLTDRETVTAFALRVDRLEFPRALPLPDRVFYRLRPGAAAPSDPWWAWAASRGWARSSGAPLPEAPLKYGVYRLALADGEPRWHLVKPELSVPPE